MKTPVPIRASGLKCPLAMWTRIKIRSLPLMMSNCVVNVSEWKPELGNGQ